MINPIINWQPIYFFKFINLNACSITQFQIESNAFLLSSSYGVFELLLRSGYQALHQQPKKNYAISLYGNIRRGMSKNLLRLYKNLNLGFFLFITLVAIFTPESVLSKMQPKYVTFEYYLIFISSYGIFNGIAFLILFLLLKRIDLVLSSTKWMLSLFSTNQSHIKLKFLLSWISISLISLC